LIFLLPQAVLCQHDLDMRVIMRNLLTDKAVYLNQKGKSN